MHDAARHWVPIPVLRYLVDQCPDALQVRNTSGLLPVHLAVRREQSEYMTWVIANDSEARTYFVQLEMDSIKFLVERWPASVLERDALGRTLVHSALAGAPHRHPTTPGRRVALFMLRHCPEAALAADAQGFLPVHVAASVDAPLDILYGMMQLQHGQLRGRGGSGVGGSQAGLNSSTSVGRALLLRSGRGALRADGARASARNLFLFPTCGVANANCFRGLVICDDVSVHMSLSY